MSVTTLVFNVNHLDLERERERNKHQKSKIKNGGEIEEQPPLPTAKISIAIDTSVHGADRSAGGAYDTSGSGDLVASQCQQKLFQAQRFDQHCTEEPG